MASTVADLFRAREGDDHPGLWCGDRCWSWHEVVVEADVRASLLESLLESFELPAQRRHVGVLLDNVAEYVFLLGAAAASGAVVVGINPTRRGAEMEGDVRHTDCGLVITDRSHLSLLNGLDLGCPVVVIDEPAWTERVDAHRRPAAATPAAAAPAAEDLYLLLFTSGSTGAPKAVRMTQGRAARTAKASAAGFSPADVLYCAMPLFHGNALLANLFPAVAAGATVVLRPRFSASAFLPDVRRYRCTYFNYVGRALSYILAIPEEPDDGDNPLKWGLGSEASPRDIAEFRRRFRCHVVEGYGSSEGAVVIQPYPGMPADALGRPAPGLDVAAIDPETGEECAEARFDADHRLLNPAEAVGEIVGRNALRTFEGYYANPEADAERAREGWYWTGDLGYRDADGTFYFAGRTADWLRVDGENFAAGPVERLLGRFPGVAAVAVYAVPDPTTGDQVMAALEFDDGADFDPAAFAAFLEEQADLGTKWAPRFVRIIDALPATATGKIDRKPLRAERWETPDPVWWRPAARQAYRRLTGDDVAGLRQAFADSGRAALLA